MPKTERQFDIINSLCVHFYPPDMRGVVGCEGATDLMGTSGWGCIRGGQLHKFICENLVKHQVIVQKCLQTQHIATD